METFLFRGERAVHEVLPFDRPQVLDEMLVLAAPVNEGAFGDAELLGDLGEADAFGAQLDKFLNGFLSFQLNLSGSWRRASPCGRPTIEDHCERVLFEIAKAISNGLR